MSSRPVIVAGNGMSLTRIAPGRVLETDFIIRTNNFFFETQYYLGRRVDLAMMGGDPRVAPFMFETLWQCRKDYDLQGWSSFNPKVVPAGNRRFSTLFQPMRYRDAHVERAVEALCAKYGKVPMTGTYALLMAHGMGAEQVILAGVDLYDGGRRYPFEPGRHYRDLMGADVNARGADARLHDTALDREVLEMLLARGDMAVMRSVETGVLESQLPLAPQREGPALRPVPRPTAPTDWAPRSGAYPIRLLKVLRRGSSLRRKLFQRKIPE